MTRRALTIIIILLLSVQLFGFALTSDNGVDTKSTNVSGTISSDTTWDLAGSPYIVVGLVTVQDAVTLTIDPGVEVRFNGYFSLKIEGNLTAIGTSGSKIVFASNAPVPFPNDWNRIQVDPTGHVEMSFCEISHSNIGIYLYISHWNSIRNSNFMSNTVGMLLDQSENNTISHNMISSSIESGLLLMLSPFNNIINNTITSTSLYQGIELDWSHYNRIRNNTLTFNGYNGIYMLRSTNNIIENNNASNNLNYHGISIDESDSNYFSNNTAMFNSIQGIWMGSSSNNTIINNALKFNTNNGIYLNSATNNRIIGNNASYNVNFNGISIDENSDQNFIANNAATSNWGSGILLWTSRC
jgi:parallel beta-helix repeat protein